MFLLDLMAAAVCLCLLCTISSWRCFLSCHLQYAERLANVADDAVAALLAEIAAAEGIVAGTSCVVYIAKDTRPSSEV